MQTDRSTSFKKIATLAFILAGVLAAAALILKIYQEKDKFFGVSALNIESVHSGSDVYLDGKQVGKAPYESKTVKPGIHKVKLVSDSDSQAVYEGEYYFAPASMVVVKRELSKSSGFTSGQSFWLDPKDLSSKISVVSEPSEATVYIDDVEVGKTPFSSSTLSDGGYDLKVVKEGYESQTARVKIQKGFKLNVSVDLFPLPAQSERLTTFAGSKMVYDLSIDKDRFTLDVPGWIKLIDYWLKTRNVTTKFSYFVDYVGKIYSAEGNEVPASETVQLKAGDNVAYLGRKNDGGMTKEASSSLVRLVGIDMAGKRIKVLATPTGWLRVRSEPSLNGSEITRLNTGDEVSYVETRGDWYRVITSDGKEGWVSGAYVREISKAQ